MIFVLAALKNDYVCHKMDKVQIKYGNIKPKHFVNYIEILKKIKQKATYLSKFSDIDSHNNIYYLFSQ